MKSKSIATLKAQMEAIRTEKTEKIRAEKDVNKKRSLAAEYDAKTAEMMDKLASDFKK